MILVMTGTHFQPFDRLIKAADEYAGNTTEPVIIQTGVSTYKCSNAKSFSIIPKDEMSQMIKDADILIMQGGWGALSESIDKGKRIIAVPRIEGVEHIHDQEQIVRKLESLDCVLGVYDIKDLPQIIDKARTFEFKPLQRGNSSIIKMQLDNWFK